MLEAEARWIGARLETQPLDAISPLLNLGSGTLRFRTQLQPWIDRHVFAPLRARGVSVVHCDVAADPGVDLVADLLAADGPARIAALAPRAIVCSNVLEHVPDPRAFARRYFALLPPGGLAIVTTPFAYPYHPDPIDTLFRPSLRELEALHPGAVVRASATVTGGSFRAEVRARPSRLLAEIAALPAHFRSGRGVRASRLLNLWTAYSASCCVLERAC